MKKLSSLLIVAMAIPSMAIAATDGVLGDTSVGTIGLSIKTVEPTPSGIQITGLEDILYPAIVPGNIVAKQGISNICVYSNVADTYTIAIESDNLTIFGATGNEGGLLVNVNDTSQRVAYGWALGDGAGNFTNNTSPNTSLISSGVVGCGGNPAAFFSVNTFTMPANFAVGTVFTDTLTLTVTPE